MDPVQLYLRFFVINLLSLSLTLDSPTSFGKSISLVTVPSRMQVYFKWITSQGRLHPGILHLKLVDTSADFACTHHLIHTYALMLLVGRLLAYSLL